MNTLAQSVRVGLFIILGAALIWIAYEALSEKTVTKSHAYSLKAPFSNLKQIKPGDDVRMAGVKIGVVQSTKLEGRSAVAVLLIEEAYTVPSDAEATITTPSLLGDNFVSISLGSDRAPPLLDGATLNTVASADFNTMLTELSEVGKQLKTFLGGSGGTGGADTFFAKLNTILDDNRDRIDATIQNFQIITQSLVDGKGTLGKLINDDRLYQEVLQVAQDVRKAAATANDFMGDAQAVFTEVKEGKGTLGTLLTSDQLAQDIETTVANFRSFSEKLNSAESTLGRLISDDSLYQDAQLVLQKVDRKVDGLGEAGPLTAVGVALNALF